MKNAHALNSIKWIAVVASADKRKELIEWSYANKGMLAGHELIATIATAGLLESLSNNSGVNY